MNGDLANLIIKLPKLELMKDGGCRQKATRLRNVTLWVISLNTISWLINWFEANKLSLNIAKTNYIRFPFSKFVNVGRHMKVYAGADEFIRNECCKCLGITIDDKLGWLDHINSINITLSRSLYIVTLVKHMLANYILRQLYYTIVKPYLTYGIFLWGSTSRT